MVEQRNDVSQAAILASSHQQALSFSSHLKKDERREMHSNRKTAQTHFLTSTFPNVNDTSRMSNSSFLAEKARSKAKTSSTPYTVTFGLTTRLMKPASLNIFLGVGFGMIWPGLWYPVTGLLPRMHTRPPRKQQKDMENKTEKKNSQGPYQ